MHLGPRLCRQLSRVVRHERKVVQRVQEAARVTSVGEGQIQCRNNMIEIELGAGSCGAVLLHVSQVVHIKWCRELGVGSCGATLQVQT